MFDNIILEAIVIKNIVLCVQIFLNKLKTYGREKYYIPILPNIKVITTYNMKKYINIQF